MKNDRTVTTVIDPERCTGCGACIPVCPKETISLENGCARVTGTESLNCGHCAAVCPTGAIRVGEIDEALSRFETFSVKNEWTPYRRFDTAKLVSLMQSRRSCRNFKESPVNRAVLEDLIKIGITAPSGSNCQLWSFTVLENRNAVLSLAGKVADFFKRTNRIAENAWLRGLLKLIGKPELSTYFHTYYESVKTAMDRWDQKSTDLLFHGAPAAIVVSSRNDASCPSEDALLATQNMLLAAHTMGLGTCLIGFVIEAMRRDRKIVRSIGIPEDETPYAVIALGYPNEVYRRITGRRRVAIRYFKAAEDTGIQKS